MKIKLLLTFLVSSVMTFAQQLPVVKSYSYEDQSYIVSMSDNGKFAVAQPAYSDKDKAPKVVDLTSGVTKELLADGTQTVSDVTDDGSIVVGSSKQKAAYCNAATKTWTLLKQKSTAYPYGNVTAVTPDGKYAVGEQYADEGYVSIPVLWDVKSNAIIETPNLPKKDMGHNNMGQMGFLAISADGNKILGCMSFSYLPSAMDDGGCCYFVYDRTTETYKMIGFTENDTKKWTPKADGLAFVDAKYMSPNGKYITGKATVLLSNSDDDAEYPFLYDTEKDEITVYGGAGDVQGCGYSVSNDGVVLNSTPNSSPVREWNIRSGKYWYSLSQLYEQKYGKSFYAETGLDNTGTANCISADGKRIVAYPDPYGSYVIDLEKPLTEICEGMTLLGNYTVSPKEGSDMSYLTSFTVTFPYQVAAKGASNCVELIDESGAVVATSMGITASGTKITVTFRKSRASLKDGKTYKVRIPAGAVAYYNDQTQTNSEIVVTYKGREDKALAVTECYPAANSQMTMMEASTSPIVLFFSANVKPAKEESIAFVYRNEETAPIAELVGTAEGNKISLYPSTALYMHKGNQYTIRVSEGIVTDLGGNNPNEEFSVTYEGAFERQISSDDVNLFTEDFSLGVNNFMLYCGDQNTPAQEVAAWGFEKGYPWWVVSDDDASPVDLAGASHSMYNPAGKSDDWLVIPQLFIPDQVCTLEFQSQSYLLSKKDVLKVVVWESDKVYNELSPEIIAQMKKDGKVVYEELQSPGKQEEVLAGEWRDNKVSLREFAGKNVYIAFVNENEDQSAIFIDNVKVLHNVNYLVSFTNEQSVVNQESIIIKGEITGNNEKKAYSEMTLTLKNAKGETIDTYSASGLELSKNKNVKFEFKNPLALEKGVEQKFSVVCNLDGEENEVTGTVKNLAFQPVRNVVIEEFTGQSCGNCPLGIVAIEKAEKQYGSQIIPISIHTYPGDTFASGMSDYSNFLGLSAAPTGRINRGSVLSPAASEAKEGVNRYYFRKSEAGDGSSQISDLWLDDIDALMRVPVECSLSCTATLDESDNSFSVPVSVRYAMNTEDLNVNMMAVLLEDNVVGVQLNYFADYETPDLGEWSKGGALGVKGVTNYYHNDVVRGVTAMSYNGTSGLVPSSVTAGTEYTYTFRVPVTAYVKDVKNCKVAILLINPVSGAIINACVSSEKSSGIDDIISQKQQNNEAVYNLSGVRVNKQNLAPGLYIMNGKKYLKK